MKNLIMLLILLFIAITANAEPSKPLGIHLEGYSYPYPVNYFNFTLENKKLSMAYMDIKPIGQSNNKTIVLLHGGLSPSSYWKDIIKFLSEQGFRVIVPDQIGFGKSSKKNVHFTTHLLAQNTKNLLDYLGIHSVIVLGHSFGGMLAARFAIQYPDYVSQLLLEDPLGLEAYHQKISYKSTDEIYQISLHPTWEGILKTHKNLYNTWKDDYLEYAEVAYRQSLNPKFSKIAFSQALIYEMIYADTLADDLKNISVPTLLMYGEMDRVAPGKNFASPEMQKKLGNFPLLVEQAAQQIPHVKVWMFKGVGHVPHLESSDEFKKIIRSYLTF